MKKIIILIVLLLFAVTPAQSQTSQKASLFDTSLYGRGLLMEYKDRVYFSEPAFDTTSQGIFVLQDDTFQAVGYSGLTKVTLRCYQHYPYTYIKMFVSAGGKDYFVSDNPGGERWFDATFVTAESAFKIGVYKGVLNGDGIFKCRVLIEAVQ